MPEITEDGNLKCGIDMAPPATMKGLARRVLPPMTSNTESVKGAGSLDVRVWLRLLACAKIIEKRLRRNFEEQFDTTLPRFDILATLSREPEGMRMGELSKALLVSNGNVTSIVRQLNEQGLVHAESDPEDRRSAIVSLTLDGREQFEELAAAHHEWVRGMLRHYPESSQHQLLDLLNQLKSSLA